MPEVLNTKAAFRKQIQLLREAGVSLNTKYIRTHLAHVERAGRKLYGSWKVALEENGIDYGTVSQRHFKEPRRKRTREECIAAIRSRSDAGLPLSISDVLKSEGWLVAAAKQYLGSWDNLLLAAGFDPARIRKRPEHRKWSKEKFCSMLRLRAKAGLSLNSDAIAKNDPGFVDAGRKLYGSFPKALEAAGFDPKLVYRRLKRMSETEILHELLQRFLDGKPMNHESLVKEGNHRLLNSIRQVMGSYKSAIEACGFDYDDIRATQVWTQEKVIAAIQAIAERGEPLNAGYIVVHYKMVHHAACNHCGSWENAIELAGFTYDRIIKRWYFRRRKNSLKPSALSTKKKETDT